MNNRFVFVNILCLVFVVLQSMAIIPNTNVNHIVFGLWMLFLYGASPQVFVTTISQRKYLVLLFFIFFYFCSSAVASNPVIAFHRSFSFLEVLSPVFLFDLSRVSSKAVPKKGLIIVFSIVMVVNTIIAFQTIELTQGYGLRLTATDIVVKNNFALVYSLAILCPVLLYLLFLVIKKGWSFKTVVFLASVIAAIVFSISLVFQSYFMTAIILLLVGLIMVLFYGKKYGLIKSGVVIVLMLVCFLSYFNTIVGFTNSHEGLSSQVSPKLYEIHAIITGQKDNASDFNARQNLTQSSLETFLENPIFGVYHKAYDFSETENLGVGNHSEWLDILARFGLFGFLLLYFLFRSFWQSYQYSKFGLHLLLFFILGFLNPLLNFFQLFTILFYIPCLYKTVSHE